MEMLIDGEWVEASAGAVDPICDKATGEPIETAPHGTAAERAGPIPESG